MAEHRTDRPRRTPSQEPCRGKPGRGRRYLLSVADDLDGDDMGSARRLKRTSLGEVMTARDGECDSADADGSAAQGRAIASVDCGGVIVGRQRRGAVGKSHERHVRDEGARRGGDRRRCPGRQPGIKHDPAFEPFDEKLSRRPRAPCVPTSPSTDADPRESRHVVGLRSTFRTFDDDRLDKPQGLFRRPIARLACVLGRLNQLC